MIVTELIYDAAVRALLRCPDIPQHAHISMEYLRATVEDPEALRAALGAAIDAWETDYCERYSEGRSDGWYNGHGHETVRREDTY